MNKFFVSCLLCSVLFIVPIATFTIDITDTFQEERRATADFPEIPHTLTAGRLKKFFSEFDTFFADHFPLRNTFLALISHIHTLKYESADNNKCYIGRKNWLFLGNSYASCVDKLQGKIILSDEILHNQINYYVHMQSAAQKSGSEFVIFLGPNKSTIYSELLPSYIKPASTRYIDPLVASLRDAGVKIYDPTQRLMAKKTEGLLYYQTDTHWNARGAYEAFEGFITYMGLPELPPVSFREEKEMPGDLVDIGGFKTFPLIHGGKVEACWDVPSSRTSSDKTAWIFGDSFAGALKPYLEATFAHTSFFRHPEFEEVMSTHTSKPHVIIWVMVERSFGS